MECRSIGVMESELVLVLVIVIDLCPDLITPSIQYSITPAVFIAPVLFIPQRLYRIQIGSFDRRKNAGQDPDQHAKAKRDGHCGDAYDGCVAGGGERTDQVDE